ATVLNIPTAGRESFPDEFLSTSRPSPILRRPTRREVVIAAGVTGAAAMAIGIYAALRPGPTPPPTIAAIETSLVATPECSRAGCSVAAVRTLVPGYWWIRLSGSPDRCYVV